MRKHCSGCNKDKDIDYFPLDRSRKDGRNALCGFCRTRIRHSYYNRHKKLEKARARKWSKENRERCNTNRNISELGPRHIFINTIACARRRGIFFNLSFDEYVPISLLSCHYCGGPLPKRGSGLDRVDSNKGYVIENVVPCCHFCNQSKMNQTQSEFIARCVRIAEKHKLRLSTKLDDR